MVLYHKPVKRKPTGGRKKPFSQKKKRHFGRFPTETKVASEAESDVRKKIRVRGGGIKIKLYYAKYANVLLPDTGEFKKVRILSVSENKANREFKRKQVITRGAIILTELGEAKVTSRPGQDGVVNAILIKETKAE